MNLDKKYSWNSLKKQSSGVQEQINLFYIGGDESAYNFCTVPYMWGEKQFYRKTTSR